MEAEYTLSYIVVTRNKLEFLREAMPRLIENRQPGEEIIVVDGASTDGATEYLQELYEAGHIDQFLSEPDVGEAHALNKGLLMARGELIKLISDDDVFHYPTIQKCKEFMQGHPEIDVLGGGMAGTHIDRMENIAFFEVCEEYFREWIDSGKQPFVIQGLPLMLRRKSLPLVGLFHTLMKSVDGEFGLRISLIANLAYCTSAVALRIGNPKSGYERYAEQIRIELKRQAYFYGWDPPADIKEWMNSDNQSLFQKVVKRIRRLTKRAGQKLFRLLRPADTNALLTLANGKKTVLPAEAFEIGEKWLNAYNAEHPCTFLCGYNHTLEYSHDKTEH